MVSQDVEMDDGLLHALCVRPLKPSEMFMRGLRLRFGTVEDDDKLIYLPGRDIEVRTGRKREVTADGELVTTTPIVCRCLPQALEVFVPREESDAESEKDNGNQAEPLMQATG